MNAAPPRWDINEFLLKNSLLEIKNIIVEGATDKRFFKVWLENEGLNQLTAIYEVDEFDIPAEKLHENNLNDGRRSRVILFARISDQEGDYVRAIADRDTGVGVDQHRYAPLLWTDFPAIESYWFDARVLDRANVLFFKEQLPSGENLVHQLSVILREIFLYRLANPNMPTPNYSKIFDKQEDLQKFNVSRSVHVNNKGRIVGDDVAKSGDPRTFTYGHDLAGIIFEAYKNRLKNRLNCRSAGEFEEKLFAAAHTIGAYKEEPLFVNLLNWVNSSDKKEVT